MARFHQPRAQIAANAPRPDNEDMHRTDSICLFVTLEDDVPAGPSSVAGARKVCVHTPATAYDPHLHDGPPPACVVQVYFDSLRELEAADYGPLGCAGRATCEAMEVRSFAVPEPRTKSSRPCTYLVAYEGPAQDPAAWHDFYLSRHPPLMARLPGIRELEIYLPLEWTNATPWRRVASLQRNKVVFDSPEALTAALNSPARNEMRADFHRFPPYSGKVTHFPMHTTILAS